MAQQHPGTLPPATCKQASAQLKHKGPSNAARHETIASELEALIKRETREVATGAFMSTGQHVVQGPGLGVVGLGLLPLPVDSKVAQTHLGHCGAGDNEWEVDATQLSFDNPAWPVAALGPFIRAASTELGVPEGVTCAASLRNLIVSGPGCCSLAHRVCSESEPGA